MKMEEKIEGRKVQILPFLLSRNMRKDTLKNNGFCPNEVIHFTTTNTFNICNAKYCHYTELCDLSIWAGYAR